MTSWQGSSLPTTSRPTKRRPRAPRPTPSRSRPASPRRGPPSGAPPPAEARALGRRGIDLAQAAVDPQAVGAGEALLGEILIDSGQPREAVELLEAAIAAFPDTGGGGVRATMLANLSRALLRTSQPARAIQAADPALDLAEHLGLERSVG